jgi:hypothetical protein
MRPRLERVVGAQNDKIKSMNSVDRERESQIRERKGQKFFEIDQSNK